MSAARFNSRINRIGGGLARHLPLVLFVLAILGISLSSAWPAFLYFCLLTLAFLTAALILARAGQNGFADLCLFLGVVFLFAAWGACARVKTFGGLAAGRKKRQ